MDLNRHMQQAVALFQQGDYARAESMYQEALGFAPRHAGILNLLGILYLEQDKTQAGLDLLRQAVASAPHSGQYLFNLGEALCRQGAYAEGVAVFQMLESIAPEQALLPLAQAHAHLRQYAESCRYYEVLFSTQLVSAAQTYADYAAVLRALGRFRSAMQAYNRAVELEPALAESHFQLADLYRQDKQYANAFHHYQQTLKHQPDHINALFNVWRHHAHNDQPERAQPMVQQLGLLLPHEQPAIVLASALDIPLIPQSVEQKVQTFAHLQQLVADPDAFSLTQESQLQHYDVFPPYTLAYYGFDDVAWRQQFAQRMIETNLIPQLSPAVKSRSRPKIGVVVTAGHEGVFLKCMAGLLLRVPEDYEWVVVCSSPDSRRILAECLPDAAYVVLATSLLQAAQQLQAADFDLLYYWEIGTDAYNYFLPFFRTAPRQVTSWGWPVSSGIPFVAAYFSSDLLEPEHPQAFYSERLLLGHSLLSYYEKPPVPTQVSRAELGLSEQDHVYLCTQNLRKVQPEMDDWLMGILQQDTRAHIFFIADRRLALQDRLQKRWAARGLDLQRLHILPRMDRDTYLTWVKAATVILDTPCYTGGLNTNADAFAAGTPVVTLCGTLHRSRYTSAAYQRMGYTECITFSPEAYVAKALQLAQNKDYRHGVSQAILARQETLMADPNAVRDFCLLLEQALS